MSRRWRDPEGFRPERATGDSGRPSRVQAIALLTGLVVAAGSVAAASYLVEPTRARSFDVVHGSLFLTDSVAPVAIDLASGRPTVRLVDANKQVSATSMGDVAVVPLQGGTLLLNTESGEFNMVDATGFVIKNNKNGGVRLPAGEIGDHAVAVASGDSAYIVRTGQANTAVYLVTPGIVHAAEDGRSPQPRAFRNLGAGITADTPGQVISANGNLWVLRDSGPTRRITELNLPTRSSAGAQLLFGRSGGVVLAPAAIGTATSGDATTVGIVSRAKLQLIDRDDRGHTIRFSAPEGFDRILPATGGDNRLSYLLHGSAGWSLLSVGVDGSGLRGPTLISAIAADAPLIAPAASAGALYTMTSDTGQLLRITGDARATPLLGVTTYPLEKDSKGRVLEPAGYTDATAIARGTRVVINSPSHLQAVVLFTDRTPTRPLRIVKSTAVGVNTTGGALALTTGRVLPPPVSVNHPVKPRPTSTVPQPSLPVNNHVDCTATSQKPHVPLLTASNPGPRSVQLTWYYAKLGQQDCVPSRYLVTATALSGDAPGSPEPLSVTNATGVTLAGLYPNTTYNVTVTAYINKQGTRSQPQQFRTGPQGPNAPVDVTAAAAATGAWTVRWTACGTAGDKCLPSTRWVIIPSFCDNASLSAPPAEVSVAADPRSATQSTSIPASDALLGRAATFVVQGYGANGEPGTLSAPSGCVRSWRAPDASAITLTATVPSSTAQGQSVPVSVALGLGTTPTLTVGGLGASVTFTVSGDGQTQSSGALAYDGTSNSLQATFGAILPGRPYTVTATVSPPGHSEAAVTTAAVGVSTASEWPAPTVTAQCTHTVLTCQLAVQISGVSSQGANGEQFTLADSSSVVCGSLTAPLTSAAFDPSTTAVTATFSQLNGYYGPCSATVALVEVPGYPTPYYGGLTSPQASTTVDFGPPDTAGLGQGDLAVAWSSSGAAVQYTGTTVSAADLAQLTANWSETIAAPDGTPCGSAAERPGPDAASAATIPVSSACVNAYGASTDNWTVTVTYANAVDGSAGPTLTYPLAGPPPGYQPCAPNLSAAWGATIAAGVSVTSVDDPSTIAGCTGWTYDLGDPSASPCGNAAGAPPVTIVNTCAAPLAPGTWTVVVRYIDTAGKPQTVSVDVTGDPPTA